MIENMNPSFLPRDTYHGIQQIQEAVEILRDPTRRLKHDQELSRFRRVVVEEYTEYDASYTGWRPHNPMWHGVHNPSDRYMYSYGNSVHMNPNSPESQEEKERVEHERRLGEEIRMEQEEIRMKEEEERFMAKQRSEEEVLKEERRRRAMRARIIRDEELMAEGHARDDDDSQESHSERVARPGYSTNSRESGYDGGESDFYRGQQYVQEGEYCRHLHWECGEGFAAHNNAQDDLLNFQDSAYEDVDQASGSEYEDHEYYEEEESYEDHDADDSASSNQSTQRTATEYNTAYRERDDLSSVNLTADESKLSDSQYETGREDASEEDPFYFSFSEHTQSVNGGDTSSLDQEQPTVSEDNYIRVDTDLHSQLAPFLPLFESKLNHPSGLYTRADMHCELRGIVMETFCGWLENLRLGFSEADIESTSSHRFGDLHDTSETCDHLGYWTKEYGRDECELCHRWKPIFTLTCPSCGLKACVVCKFRC
ncbi:DnaJ domain protein [Aspergillus affinis]|uniref:DnaJ domain protein n=1 Tax=Aspergillus affinis TaxID=1070780 RepID=UPI0022FF1156|nr:DnaJ-domain-containing protein [Aspergillus affinis]KAI9040081.1 DnaJ-domain-containing protein [Aspergillus affinis]